MGNNRYIRYGSETSTESTAQILVTEAGTAEYLYVTLTAAPGVGNSRIFTFSLNGVSQTLAVTITGAATTGSDLVNTVSLVSGDLITILHTTTGNPTNATGIVTFKISE